VDYAIAESGKLLVVKVRGQKGLSVYDTTKRKVTGVITLPTTDFTFGAGGGTAVVFLKDQVEFQSWSLRTLTKIKSKAYADPIVVTHIVMGHSRDDIALICTRWGVDRLLNHEFLRIMDVGSFALRPMPLIRESFPGELKRDRLRIVHYRSNSNLSCFTRWETARGHGRGDGDIFVGDQDGYREVSGHSGYLAPAGDANVYTSHGVVHRNMREPSAHSAAIEKREGYALVPALNGPFHLGVQPNGSITVFRDGVQEPLAQIGTFPGLGAIKTPIDNHFLSEAQRQNPLFGHPFVNGPLPLDKRIIFGPMLGYIILVPLSNNTIIQRDFDAKATLDQTEKQYLLLTSLPQRQGKAGREWTYQVKVLSKHGPVEFRAEKSPQGMTVSPGGRMKWDIPNGVEGKAIVILVVTDPKGNAAKQEFTITFK
jgi:hypothetical protein